MMSELEWMRIFGEKLRVLIKDAWMTQKELAEAIGVTEATISHYINAERMPSVKAIVNISYEFGIEPTELIDFGDTIE